MAKTHKVNQILIQSDGPTIQDTGATYSGDTVTNSDLVIPANGAGANAIEIAFTAANFKSLVLKATVPCVVSLTGATVINGITIGTVTLVANAIAHVVAITGNVTAISIGANTTTSGAAGVLELSLLRNT